MEAMAEFLKSYEWDYFLTVTTRKPWHDSYALKREAFKTLNQVTATERAFLCTEPYYIRSGVHLHGIVKVDKKYKEFVPLNRIWGNMFQRFGRSKVEFARSNEAVAGYCGKYVLKSSGDYDLYGRSNNWLNGAK